MIREMKEEDLQQCGVIYAKAFPIEYWGIDWNPDNAKEYLLDYYEQKKIRRMRAFYGGADVFLDTHTYPPSVF